MSYEHSGAAPTAEEEQTEENELDILEDPDIAELEPLRVDIDEHPPMIVGVDDMSTGLRRGKRMFPPPQLCRMDSGDHLTGGWKVENLSSPTGTVRRKFVFSVPGILQQEKPREYRLKAFVIFMSFLIVMSMSLIFVYHNEKMIQLMQRGAVGERIRFKERTRVVRFFDSQKKEILHGRLALGINIDNRPFNCLKTKGQPNQTLYFNPVDQDPEFKHYLEEYACLDWRKMVRLRIQFTHYNNTKLRCYQFLWLTNATDFVAKDCYSVGNAQWFGVGDVRDIWPLNHTRKLSAQPIISGDLIGRLARRRFVSENGVFVLVDDEVPLYLDYEPANQEVCLIARANAAPYLNRRRSQTSLNYSICMHETSNNPKLLQKSLQKTFPKAQSYDNRTMDVVFDSTVLLPSEFFPNSLLYRSVETEASLMNFSTSDVKNVIGGIIFVLPSHVWHKTEGDFKFDHQRFPGASSLAQRLEKEGLRLTLTFHPFISTVSESYVNTVLNGSDSDSLFVMDESRTVPVLTRFSNIRNAVILDMTRLRTVWWLRKKLTTLREDFGIGGFFLAGAASTAFPAHHTTYKNLSNPDIYGQYLTEAVSQSSILYCSDVATTGAVNSFVRLSPRASSWEALQSLIASILNIGLIGFNFVIPGSVGGDYPVNDHSLPDRELYIRWLQVAIFLPGFQLSTLPLDYDPEVVLLFTKYAELRRRLVIPLLKNLTLKLANETLPFVRPVQWLFGNETVTSPQDIKDEFTLGDDLLVAPVLHPGVDERDIYLPPGFWRDELDGSTHKGNKWIYGHYVREDQIAHFTRTLVKL